MAIETSEAEDRAKQPWERIFTLVVNDQRVPAGRRPTTDATPKERRASLIVVAMALDELIETGTLQPDPRLRLVESLRNLLLVLDSLTPLPEGLIPPGDLTEVVDAIRTAQEKSTL